MNAYYGWQKVLRTPKFLSKEEQAQYYYEGIKNQNLDAGYDVSGDPRKDWNYAVPQTVMDVLNGTNPYKRMRTTRFFRLLRNKVIICQYKEAMKK